MNVNQKQLQMLPNVWLLTVTCDRSVLTCVEIKFCCYCCFHVLLHLKVVDRVLANYLHMAVLIGGGNLTKGQTKNF